MRNPEADVRTPSGDTVVVERNRSWSNDAVPVVLSLGTLAVLNALWNNIPLLANQARAAHSLVVYLLGGSGLASVLLYRALREGRLTRRDIGLAPVGWQPFRRLFGMVMIVVVGYGMYANLQSTLPPGFVDAANHTITVDTDSAVKVVQKPSWGDFCFWFVLLLAASLAELLVFVGVGFCMVEHCLRDRGMRPVKATVFAALFASIVFGLYHFTHAPSWWPMVFIPLMPVMLINIACFVVTRNFYLTLGLHGTFAAIGMTSAQYLDPSIHPAALQEPTILGPLLISFVIPFLFLHWLEAQQSGVRN